MKFKLVEYPYGREIGLNQDTIWFIQGTNDDKEWSNYVWCHDDCSPSVVVESNRPYPRACPPISAYLTIEAANEAFDKIITYYREHFIENPIRTIREIEI